VLLATGYSEAAFEKTKDSIPVNQEKVKSNKTELQHYIDERNNMVKTGIFGRGVKNIGVLNAMKNVKRHLFVPDNLVYYAYEDRPLPVGYGQTISQPYIVAYMTEKLELKPDYKVLEIGTGSGYQAAVLAEIVKDVYTVEIIPELAKSAKEKFKNRGYKNIHSKTADGYYGWEKYAPYDAIIVTAAAGNIPPPLLKQLKNGGKMIIPVGSTFMVQYLILLEKIDGKIVSDRLLPVRFVPLTRKN